MSRIFDTKYNWSTEFLKLSNELREAIQPIMQLAIQDGMDPADVMLLAYESAMEAGLRIRCEVHMKK